MTMRNNGEESTGDLFYNFYYEDSKDNAVRILRKIADALESGEMEDIEIDIDDEDDE